MKVSRAKTANDTAHTQSETLNAPTRGLNDNTQQEIRVRIVVTVLGIGDRYSRSASFRSTQRELVIHARGTGIRFLPRDEQFESFCERIVFSLCIDVLLSTVRAAAESAHALLLWPKRKPAVYADDDPSPLASGRVQFGTSYARHGYARLFRSCSR